MRRMKLFRLAVLWVLLGGMFTPFSPRFAAPQPIKADPATLTLDGVRDTAYVKIATDPTGDLGPCCWNGINWTDLTNLYVAADATTLYVYVDSSAYALNTSAGQIGLALDVDGKPNSGGATDPWDNAITFAYRKVDGTTTPATVLPDYIIRGNIINTLGGGDAGNGWTELRHWNGTGWDGSGTNWGGITGGAQIGTHVAYSDTQGIEFAIPLADIGNPAPANVHLQFFATQGGGSKGAYDTLPSDDQATGWDDPTTQTQLVSVPLATDVTGDLFNSWSGIAWMDAPRLHLWADHDALHLFVASTAYSRTVSAGQIGLAIDTKAGGGTNDAWNGTGITYAYTTTWQNLGATPVVTTTVLRPDYLIRGNVFNTLTGGDAGNGWTEFRAWSGSNWDTGGGTDWGGIGNTGQPSQPSSNVAWSDGEGLRLTIPLAQLNVAAGDTIHLEFFGTQSGWNQKGAFDTLPTDDQATGWDDATTQNVLASYTIPAIPAVQASHDNTIWRDGLYHDSRDLLYRTPFGAVPVGTAVTLRLRAFKDDLTGARLRVTDDVSGTLTSYPMVLGGSDGTYDYWEYTLPTDHATLLWYRFEAVDGTTRAYYEDDANWGNQPWVKGGEGKALDAPAGNNYQLTVYLPDYTTPDWLVNGTIYQIFPDRFRNGDPANDVISGTFYYGDDEKWGNPQIYTGTVAHTLWNEQIWDPRVITSPYYSTYSNQFYGGDLQGIIDKLDYLKNAGFTVLYLNPIFQSPSNHKYDTTSYETIDPALGTYATFTRLMTETQARGMHVILDGVFNHTSSDSIYMDKYSRYPSLGAYESQVSPYYDWYFFNPWPTGYTSWWGYQSLPKLNSANPIVRSYIYSGTNPIATRWIMTGSQPLASGWRFDVASDVDPGYANAPTNGYWIGFRNAVRSVYSQTAMISEEWGNASAFLLGNQMDSTMNYRFRNALLGFVRDTGWDDTNSNFPHQTPAQFMETLQSLQEDYPAPAWYAMMNLVGSHDTNRIRFVIRESGDVTATVNARQKLVALAQYSLPGAPTVYYADEVGASADGKPCSATDPKFCGDPYNRLPYPWDDAAGSDYSKEPGILPYYTALGQARLANPALRTGSLDPLLADDTNKLLAYGRKEGSYAALTLFNRNTTTQTLALELFGYLPLGTVLTDVTTLNEYVYTADPFTITLVGNGGALLVAQGLPTPPAPPTLSLTSENDTRILIHWTGSGATYNVYRSPVSGSGYTRVATDTTGTVFTDTAVVNGQKYYYVVTALDAGKLESAASNEISAVPHVPVDSYTIVNITPMTMTHTLGIQPTAPISVEIYVAGVTTPTGQGAGLLMELGYSTHSTPNASWLWTPMAYSGDVGDNDQYVARLTPESAGTFYYGARVSADGGRDWAYGLYSSGVFIPGILTVTASADTTAPAAPPNLRLAHWDIDHLTLAWDAPADPDVYAYDLYRSDSGHTAAVIGRILSPTLVYTDSAVTTGILYTYTVQALDTSFNRSTHSNAVSGMPQQRLVTVTLNVTVPTFTPAGATICIPGDSSKIMGSSWDPSTLPMAQVDATHWQKVLVVPDGTRFQYKYTRCASWDVVEWWRLSDTEHIESTENRALTVEYGTDGNQVVNDTVWNWRDPLVVAYNPANGAAGVAVSSVVTATWSRPLAASTVTTASVRLVSATGTVVGTATYISQTDRYETVFTPAAGLRGTTRYTATLTTDLMGANNDSVKLQQPFSWSFTTGNWIMYLPLVMKNR